MNSDTRLASAPFLTEETVRQFLVAIVGGDLPAGELIRYAAERSLAEIKGGHGVWYDWSTLEHVCGWIGGLELPDYGEPFLLQPYQIWILSQVFARKLEGSDKPATRLLMIESARGSAKTYLGAAILAYALVHESTKQQLDLCSINAGTAGRDAADLVREFAYQTGDPLKAHFAPGAPAVVNTETRSSLTIIPPDPEKWHGRRSRIAFVDEAAHHEKEVLARVMTGASKRDDGQVITFSTPHSTKEVPYYAFRDQMVGELRENHCAISQVCLAWCIDDDDPIEPREDLFLKANPGLGVTIKVDDLRSTFESMVVRGSGATRSDYIRQHFALFDDQVSQLIDMQQWRACQGEPTFFRGDRVWVGIDLSRGSASGSNRTDICSITIARVDNSGHVHIRARHYLPENRVKNNRHRSRVSFDRWIEDGRLSLCAGDFIDPLVIEDEVRAAVDRFKVDKIIYDVWTFPKQLMHVWESQYRWPLHSRARAEYVVPATEGLDDLVRQRKVIHDGDPVLEQAIKNARVKNYQGGRRPDKDPSRSLIDPLMSLIYCLSGVFEAGADRVSLYESDDLVI